MTLWVFFQKPRHRNTGLLKISEMVLYSIRLNLKYFTDNYLSRSFLSQFQYYILKILFLWRIKTPLIPWILIARHYQIISRFSFSPWPHAPSISENVSKRYLAWADRNSLLKRQNTGTMYFNLWTLRAERGSEHFQTRPGWCATDTPTSCPDRHPESSFSPTFQYSNCWGTETWQENQHPTMS